MSTECRRVRVDPARRHEPHRPVDLAGHPLVPLAGPGGEHELLVPLVHPRQVAHPGAGHRADQVHRRRRVRVGADHPGRVGDPGLRGGGQRVDDVAAVGRQAERIQRGRAGLGVLAGDPGDLDHRHRRAVGQHDGHLQQGADVAPDVRFGVVDDRSPRSRRPAAGRPRRGPPRPVGRPACRPRRAPSPAGPPRARRARPAPARGRATPAAARPGGPARRPAAYRSSGGSGGRLGRMSAGMSMVQFTTNSLGGKCSAAGSVPGDQAPKCGARRRASNTACATCQRAKASRASASASCRSGPARGIGGEPAPPSAAGPHGSTAGTSRGRSGIAPQSWASTTWS